MDQQDRLAKITAKRRDVDERNVDPIRGKMLKLGGALYMLLPHGRTWFVKEKVAVRTPAWSDLARRTEND